MDDLTPLVVLLIGELAKGNYEKIAIPREYLKNADGVGLAFEWTDDHLYVMLARVADESSGKSQD